MKLAVRFFPYAYAAYKRWRQMRRAMGRKEAQLLAQEYIEANKLHEIERAKFRGIRTGR